MNDKLIIDVNDDSYEKEVLESEIPVLVDFWATWCGPCKIIAPILEDIAIEYKDKIKIVKLNVEENRETTSKAVVRNIPTLKIFKNGVEVGNKVGSSSKSQLIDFIEASIVAD